MTSIRLGRIIALATAATAGCSNPSLHPINSAPSADNKVEFGTLPLGARKVRSVTVQNLGEAPLSLLSAVVAAPFAVTGQPDAIPPGGQADVLVAFAPVAAGEVTTTLVLGTDSTDVPSLSVDLHGAAFATGLGADQTRLDFGDVAVGSSRTLLVHLTNNAPVALSPSVDRAGSTDFAAAPIGSLGNLDPQAQTTIDVTFAPTVQGPASGALSFTCATCPVASIELAGNGTAGATGGGDGGTPSGCSLAVAPGRIDFGAVPPGGAASGTIELRSIGTLSCTLPKPFLDSTTDPAFSLPSLVRMLLAPGASTSIRVALRTDSSTPALISGALVIVSNDHLHPTQTVALSANVQAPAGAGKLVVAPSSLSFTGTVASAIAPQSLLLSNTGGASLSWTAASDDPTVLITGAGGSLAPGQSRGLAVTVAPQSASGARTQHVTIDAGPAGSAVVPIEITLSSAPAPGAAQLLVLPASLSFTAAQGNAPADEAVLVYNVGGQALSWTAAPDDRAISVAPSAGNLPAGGSRTISVRVAPQAAAGVRTQHILFSAGAAGSVRVTARIEFTGNGTPLPPPCGNSVWPKFHQGNALDGLSRIDTSKNGGRVRWRAFVGPPAPCAKGAQTGGLTRCGTYLASPSLGSDGTVYQLGGDGKLRAFDRADGSLKWATMTAPPSLAPQESTPTVVADGSIFLGTGGGQTLLPRFWHLDRNGNPLRSSGCGGGACGGWSSSPAVAGDGTLWLANADGGTIDAVDQAGRVLRRIELAPHVPLQTMSGALGEGGAGYWTGNGNLFVTSPAGLVASFTSPQAESDPLYPRQAAPALTRDGLLIYPYQWQNPGGIFSTRIYAFDSDHVDRHESWHLDLPRTKGVRGLPSGAGLSEQEEADAVAWRSGITSPAVGPDGTIYVGHLDGIYAVQNTPTGAVEHGRVLWSLSTAQIVGSPAVGADGRVYFGSTDGFLYCAKDGNLIWQVKTSGQLNSSPAIGADGTVFAVSDDGWLYAVR